MSDCSDRMCGGGAGGGGGGGGGEGRRGTTGLVAGAPRTRAGAADNNSPGNTGSPVILARVQQQSR